VVALSRIQKRLKKEERFLPSIEVENIAFKPGLVELVFPKTPQTLKALQKIYAHDDFLKDYLTVTHGVTELSIITVTKKYKDILKVFAPHKPNTEIHNIAAISLRVDPKYTYTKNTFYALLKTLAPRGINIIELLTTSTEISLLVEEKDWEKTFSVFNELFKK
jgi:aspartokinase